MPRSGSFILGIKEPLRGIRFRTVPEILQAEDRSIRAIKTTGAAKGIVRLPHRWQRVVHNAGDFHLIPKMKERLRGIRFRTVPEILRVEVEVTRA